MNTTLRTASLAALVGLGMLSEARPAAACAVFTPPVAPIVTDHRMIVSVGRDESTLYDEVRYQGSPESFAWVLPISGEAKVGLSAEVLFSALDARTRVTVRAPDPKCPPPPPSSASCAPRAGAFSDAGAANDGVTVTKREVVGPYETVQLQATNPEALNQWLAANKFSIPEDVKPVVAQYVRENFNFLAMKLVPGANVQSMRPVRVTTRGSSVTLPLRMVAAGTGPVVGISLWVMAQGRYEPQNFPTFTIKQEDLAWDWTANASNFKTIRAERTAASNGRGWELESSIGLQTQQIDYAVRTGFVGGFGGRGGPPAPAGNDYAGIDASEGNPAKTPDQVRDEDMGILLGRIVPGAELRVTRMRADLTHAALNEDLVLTAPADQSLLGTTRQVTRELNEPLCPVFQGCEQVGQAPRSEAAAQSDGTGSFGGGSSCSTSNANTAGGTLLGGAFAVFGVVLARLRRRKVAAG